MYDTREFHLDGVVTSSTLINWAKHKKTELKSLDWNEVLMTFWKKNPSYLFNYPGIKLLQILRKNW
jgi:hypothetical protein